VSRRLSLAAVCAVFGVWLVSVAYAGDGGITASGVASEAAKLVTGLLLVGAWRVWLSIRDLGTWRKKIDASLVGLDDYARASDVGANMAAEVAARVARCDACDAACAALSKRLTAAELSIARMQGAAEAGAQLADRRSVDDAGS